MAVLYVEFLWKKGISLHVSGSIGKAKIAMGRLENDVLIQTLQLVIRQGLSFLQENSKSGAHANLASLNKNSPVVVVLNDAFRKRQA